MFYFNTNLARKVDTLQNPGCCLSVWYKEITEESIYLSSGTNISQFFHHLKLLKEIKILSSLSLIKMTLLQIYIYRVSHKFCNFCIHASLWHIYHVIKAVHAVCSHMHCFTQWVIKQMKVKCSLIWELIHYKFELGHNTVEATKNICFARSEVAVNQNTRWLKKVSLGCKNLDK